MLNIIKLLAVINKTKLLKMWWILALPWYRNPKWWFLFLLPKGWSWKLIEFSRSLWIYDKTKNIFDFYCHLWDTGVAHDQIVLKHSNCRYKLSLWQKSGPNLECVQCKSAIEYVVVCRWKGSENLRIQGRCMILLYMVNMELFTKDKVIKELLSAVQSRSIC